MKPSTALAVASSASAEEHLTLRQLERDGLVARTVHAEIPPRVEYTLTDEGRTLIEPSRILADWAIAHYPAIERARAVYDARASR